MKKLIGGSMKKLMLGTVGLLALGLSSAFAADMAVKAPPTYVPAPVWSWTGFYIGGNVGAGWGTTEANLNSISIGGTSFADNLPIDQNSRSGFLGGGQIGYNYQFGWAVIGVEGDFSGLGVQGTTPCIGGEFSCTGNSHWLGTVSGRIGGVVGDRTLIYVKGGAAWMNTTHSLNASEFDIAASASANATPVGGLLGLGVEYAFSPNWSAFVEYDYIQFQNQNIGFSSPVLLGPGAVANVNIQDKLSIAKIGVNYKFW
jgi:outer membrane immunogenic protein